MAAHRRIKRLKFWVRQYRLARQIGDGRVASALLAASVVKGTK